MAIILGESGSAFITPASFNNLANSAGAVALAAGYVPLFNGNVTSINVGFGTGSSGSTFQVCLYSGAAASGGGATLLATSSPGTIVASSLVNVAITSTPVLTSGTYALVLSMPSLSCNLTCDTGASAFLASQYNSTAFPYPTPPSTLPARTSGTGYKFIIWADGSSGGGGGPDYSLTVQPVSLNVSVASSITGLTLDINPVSLAINQQRIALIGPNGPDGGNKQKWRRKLTSIRQ